MGTAHLVNIGCLKRNCESKLHRDIKFDIDHGYLRVFDPRLTPEIAAQLDDGTDDTGGICYPEWLKAKLVQFSLSLNDDGRCFKTVGADRSKAITQALFS